MKFLIHFISTLMLCLPLAACTPSLASQVDMSVSLPETTITLSNANLLQRKSDISYSLANNSRQDITQDKYQIMVGIGRTDNTSTTVITYIEKDVKAGEKIEGTVPYTFQKILGDEGAHEIRLTLYKNGSYVSQVKEVVTPVMIEYK
ncbi:MAG: hypothetical protein AAB592_00465 [Patescibacteria group bacterium]